MKGDIDTSRPLAVDRQSFTSAVNAGLNAANRYNIPTSAVHRLRDVAREETLVGLNFEGCPLTLAGLYRQWKDASMPEWAREFVHVYDDAICALGAFDCHRRATCLIIQD